MFACYRPPGTDPRTRFVQWANQRLNTLVLDEDIDLVDNVQRGLATRGYRCGPLSRREAAVAWFADRIRGRPGAGARRRREGVSPRRTRAGARERILAAAVRRIASEGIDGVRIARIAMDAGVSTSLVHYHFATREALLAEALDWSYAHAGDARITDGEPVGASHARAPALDDRPVPAATAESLHEDWVLWVELWLRAVRHPELRPVAEELYARMHAWFADEIAAGIADGEFDRCDPDEVADRTLAMIDGLGIRNLIGDSTISLDRALQTVEATLARDLGLGERLVPAAVEPKSLRHRRQPADPAESASG